MNFIRKSYLQKQLLETFYKFNKLLEIVGGFDTFAVVIKVKEKQYEISICNGQ